MWCGLRLHDIKTMLKLISNLLSMRMSGTGWSCGNCVLELLNNVFCYQNLKAETALSKMILKKGIRNSYFVSNKATMATMLNK